MAMILRRAKHFLNRTGRKFIRGHSNAKVGFDKSKAKTDGRNMEIMKAERSDSTTAGDVQNSALTLMAIEEASSSSTEVLMSFHYQLTGHLSMGQSTLICPFLDESSSKDNSSSVDEFYSDECSEDNKVEGVVSEKLIDESKVNKSIVGNSDNCILTETDLIESNDKLKNMLYGGFKTIKQAKKESFGNKLGKNFQENIDKHYTPKNQSTTTPVQYMAKSRFVTKTTTDKWNKKPVVPGVSTSGNTLTGKMSVVKLSRPQRRRWNKSFRKLGQRLASNQLGKTFMGLPIDISKLVVQKKQEWRKKLDVSQASNSDSPKESPTLDHHDCELIEGQSKGSIMNHWYVDSGCSRHMTGNMALLQDVKPFRGGYAAFAGEKGGSITQQGVVTNGCISFDNVNYCEQLQHNLLSVSQMCDKEYSVMFNKSECLILKPGFVIPDEWILMRAPRMNNTYQIDMSVATTTSSKNDHLVRNDLVTGIPRMRFVVIDDCMPCKRGKQQRKSHKGKNQNSIDTPLELLHMDLFGPISIRSIGGKSYCLVVTDDYSRFSWNGVAERKIRTLIETARTMLSDAKLPVTFWAEAVNTACHVLNRVLVVKRHNKTSYELINNRPPNLANLIPFGSPCSLLLQHNDRKSKFHAKAVEGIFLGYVANSPCKRVYNIESMTVEVWFEVDCSIHSTPPEPTGPAWGFDYDTLFKSFNLPDLSVEDATKLYQYFNDSDNSNFTTRKTVPIPTPNSSAASASGTHDTEEDVDGERNEAQIDSSISIGDEAPVDPVNIESSSGTQNVGKLSTNLDSDL
ncbi:hypothetical protein L1987_46317 [Smallanthus sonchifolius]|uniref:Uncharacterized protein n=1 Tax=Smallanthus sonchifolius TaxID=185202 RepID=A0ACB9G0F8_9ASTR|nr:hypothetical protein L1987_46317 [Smallanthus sonchifolius]